MDLTSGEKSSIVRQHNAGYSPGSIAHYLSMPVGVVQDYLSGRAGWPGRISSRARQEHAREYRPEGRSRVTLPYLRCLDQGDELPWKTKRVEFDGEHFRVSRSPRRRAVEADPLPV